MHVKNFDFSNALSSILFYLYQILDILYTIICEGFLTCRNLLPFAKHSHSEIDRSMNSGVVEMESRNFNLTEALQDIVPAYLRKAEINERKFSRPANLVTHAFTQ